MAMTSFPSDGDGADVADGMDGICQACTYLRGVAFSRSYSISKANVIYYEQMI